MYSANMQFVYRLHKEKKIADNHNSPLHLCGQRHIHHRGPAFHNHESAAETHSQQAPSIFINSLIFSSRAPNERMSPTERMALRMQARSHPPPGPLPTLGCGWPRRQPPGADRRRRWLPQASRATSATPCPIPGARPSTMTSEPRGSCSIPNRKAYWSLLLDRDYFSAGTGLARFGSLLFRTRS